jgi:DNA-binding FrmR family transcriptional regulator
MQVEEECRKNVVMRLKRVQGQVAGIISMIEDGRDCAEIVTQMSAASKALDRAALRVISDGISQCAVARERGEEPPISSEQLERLFLSLA